MKKAVLYGFNTPFIGGPNNVLSRQEDQQLIKNDLLQLLLTSPGERAYRPTFGTAIRSTVFEQLDNVSLKRLQSSVLDDIRLHEPRVTVTQFDLSQVGDTNQLNIKLVATLVTNPELTISIDTVIGNTNG